MVKIFGGRRPGVIRVWVSALLVFPFVTPVIADTFHPVDWVGAAIADCHDRIAEITLHYDSSMETELVPAYEGLFSFLPPGVRVRVLCETSDDAARFDQRWAPLITPFGRRLELINTDRDLTIWARDRRIARQTPDLGRVVSSFVPILNPNYEDSKTNELDTNYLLADVGLAPAVLDASLYVEGGNVVSNRRYSFVGANVIEENFDSPRALLNYELERVLGRSVVLVHANDGSVPWCHVDMYLTPVDESTLVIADVNLGMRLLAEQELEPHNELSAALEAAVGSWKDPVCRLLPDQLDEVAEQMRKLGFTVLRIPAFADPELNWMITYNNVIMEEQDERRRVLVPVYHLPAMDDLAVAIYSALDFEVSTVDVSQIYMMGGAIRCMTNVTQRERLQRSESLPPEIEACEPDGVPAESLAKPLAAS